MARRKNNLELRGRKCARRGLKRREKEDASIKAELAWEGIVEVISREDMKLHEDIVTSMGLKKIKGDWGMKCVPLRNSSKAKSSCINSLVMEKFDNVKYCGNRLTFIKIH